VKTQLNLATQPFPRYRTANLMLFVVLVASLGTGAWLFNDYRTNPPDVSTLQVEEGGVRQEWDDLGRQIAEIEGRLQQPEASALLSELNFLSQVMARKEFSWTRVLGEIEGIIPRDTMLVGLVPEISEDGQIFLQLEVLGRTVDDIAQFITNLEGTASFRDVKVASDELVDGGRQEVRVVMGAYYVAATISEVSVPGD
jgi:Tfp pilus assembly protein PilN